MFVIKKQFKVHHYKSERKNKTTKLDRGNKPPLYTTYNQVVIMLDRTAKDYLDVLTTLIIVIVMTMYDYLEMLKLIISLLQCC